MPDPVALAGTAGRPTRAEATWQTSAVSGGNGDRGQRHIVALVPDLMDRSRIEPIARSSGIPLAFIDSAAELGAADRGTVHLAIIDLDCPGALAAVSALGAVHTVGFASHVERQLLEAGRQAGCDEVLPRSALFRRLPTLLRP